MATSPWTRARRVRLRVVERPGGLHANATGDDPEYRDEPIAGLLVYSVERRTGVPLGRLLTGGAELGGPPFLPLRRFLGPAVSITARIQ